MRRRGWEKEYVASVLLRPPRRKEAGSIGGGVAQDRKVL